MSCNIQVERNYPVEKSSDNPVIAGTFRFLSGLIIMFVGLYIALSGNFQGHGLGFFLVFATPFIIFKDNKMLQNSDKLKE